MKTVVVREPGRVATEDAAPPREPEPHELALRLHSVGICGGDLALVRGRNPLVSYPVVPGHECVAIVEHDPGGRLATGSSVAIYPTASCGDCRACRAGRFNNCAGMQVLGLSDPRGCLAERFVLPRSQVIPLPAGLGERAGALIEPLAVASHVCDRSALGHGDTALVVGAGAIGLATGLTARANGTERVLFADTLPERVEVLARLGFADFTVCREDDLIAWVKERTGTVDVVFDTVGLTSTAAVASAVLAGGGRYVTIAAAKPGHRIELDYQAFYERELTLVSSRNYTPADFRSAIGRLERGEVDPLPLRTAVYGLSGAAAAFHELLEHPERNVKVLITPDDLLGTTPLLTGVQR
ncbi:alcohol dehydrogenase catalytic domain-containing protein [Amycolatopsis benzoatilytica]|uniref:alcohol dehydrogenase catalytic domain-containing protein n=1 Tax=Amycolatopsis benzoatilytica TaxID=346045 RepID=UPI00035FEADB|nr:alcohol dehydrogenase catalytic domain-containing protein [Amycolatopsis benzoatilytica]